MNLQKIFDAQQTLKNVIRVTDTIYSPVLSDKCGCNIYLKSENLQVTGSFKVRGAYYKISKLSEAERKRGVVACSAGNHAQGVALASRKFGISATICMPEGAPISKVQATKSYGAEVKLVSGVYDDARNEAQRLRKEFGYTFIHPFDDEDVIAGQATIGMEIISQLAGVDAVVVPVGGGGLISGIAYVIKTINPRVKVYGVQSSGAPSMLNSIHDKQIEILPSVYTIADGIAVKEPGCITFDMCKKYVDDIVTVTDDEVAVAILSLMENQKMVAEGAGAVSLAAVLFDKIPDLKNKNVCCVISGGNIDVNILSRIINRGLVVSGRRCVLNFELRDKPGRLADFTRVIADCGGNIINVYEHSGDCPDVNDFYLKIFIETKNSEHIDLIKRELIAHGFNLAG